VARLLIAAMAAALIGAVIGPAPSAGASTLKPLVMAHKGLHYPYSQAPENSTGAILKAAALGVPVEIDIRLSKPTPTHPHGVPFVFHDLTLDRMTNLSGNLSDYTDTELASTCLVTIPNGTTCSPYPIPKLSTVLEGMRDAGGTLDIEVKNDQLTKGQAAAIVKRLEWSHVWAWDLLPGFKKPMILSAYDQSLTQIQSVAASRGDPQLRTEFLTVKPDPTATDHVMECVYYRNVTPDVVTELHNAGLKVDAYTANHQDAWDALAQAGVDWIMTDNLRTYLNWTGA
jgi:glycerophosphoryl diester phosphodiesterase